MEEAWRYAEGLSLVLAPMTALVAVAGPPALVALVGARWQAAATLLFPLAWGMAARVAFPFGVLAQVDGRPGLDGYLAAATLTAYAIAEFAVGWTSPARAALVVAGVDVAVAVAAMALARRLWGATRGAWRPVAQLWSKLSRGGRRRHRAARAGVLGGRGRARSRVRRRLFGMDGGVRGSPAAVPRGDPVDVRLAQGQVRTEPVTSARRASCRAQEHRIASTAHLRSAFTSAAAASPGSVASTRCASARTSPASDAR